MNIKQFKNKFVQRMGARHYVTLVLSSVLVPLAIFVVIYNVISIQALNAVNQQVAQSSTNTIELYSSLMEEELDTLFYTVMEDLINDDAFDTLTAEFDSELYQYLLSKISGEYRLLMNNSDWFTGMVLVSKPNDLVYSWFKEGYYQGNETIQMRLELEEFMENVEDYQWAGWFCLELADSHFLCRVVGTGEAYSMLMMDVAALCDYQTDQVEEEGTFIMYAFPDGTYTEGEMFITAEQVAGLDMTIGYDILQTEQNGDYLVVGETMDDYGMQILCYSPYDRSITALQKLKIGLYLCSAIILLAIPFFYLLLTQRLVLPIERLTASMRHIRDGKQKQRSPHDPFFINELQIASVTFDEMLEQIKNLKIESYEKQVHAHKVELQYRQLQLKPHFFLNCLKVLYGMAEQKKYDKVQPLILNTSQYLRYCLQENKQMISVDEELKHVNVYLQLRRDSVQTGIDLTVQTDERVGGCMVPNMVIQSFVENSCKYALKANQPLRIHIGVIRLDTDEGAYLDICIHDNGDGYPQEVLDQFADYQPYQVSTNNIGLNNVAQRLFLVYQDRAHMLLDTAMEGGAWSELIIPIE